jgi:hypothetical protein
VDKSEADEDRDDIQESALALALEACGEGVAIEGPGRTWVHILIWPMTVQAFCVIVASCTTWLLRGGSCSVRWRAPARKGDEQDPGEMKVTYIPNLFIDNSSFPSLTRDNIQVSDPHYVSRNHSFEHVAGSEILIRNCDSDLALLASLTSVISERWNIHGEASPWMF